MLCLYDWLPVFGTASHTFITSEKLFSLATCGMMSARALASTAYTILAPAWAHSRDRMPATWSHDYTRVRHQEEQPSGLRAACCPRLGQQAPLKRHKPIDLITSYNITFYLEKR